MYPVNPPVWVESTAVGMTVHSRPAAEIIGSATVREHLPKHEMSWIARTRFCLSMAPVSPSAVIKMPQRMRGRRRGAEGPNPGLAHGPRLRAARAPRGRRRCFFIRDAVSPRMYCSKCGSAVEDGAAFCSVCGAALNNGCAPHPAAAAGGITEKSAKTFGFLIGLLITLLLGFYGILLGLVGLALVYLIEKDKMDEAVVRAGILGAGVGFAVGIAIFLLLIVTMFATIFWF